MSTSEIAAKRDAILKAYPNSPTWGRKVLKMSDQQVVAIYINLQNRGKIR